MQAQANALRRRQRMVVPFGEKTCGFETMHCQ
jgi:hypothetical protein